MSRRKPRPRLIYREETVDAHGRAAVRETRDPKQYQAWRDYERTVGRHHGGDTKFFVGTVEWEEAPDAH